eukprot:97568_1
MSKTKAGKSDDICQIYDRINDLSEQIEQHLDNKEELDSKISTLRDQCGKGIQSLTEKSHEQYLQIKKDLFKTHKVQPKQLVKQKHPGDSIDFKASKYYQDYISYVEHLKTKKKSQIFDHNQLGKITNLLNKFPNISSKVH